MEWDLEQISEVLNARIEPLCTENEKQYFLWFNDNNFKFYLFIQPETDAVMLAADPVELMGMPFLEYSFNCTLIKVTDSPYGQGVRSCNPYFL